MRIGLFGGTFDPPHEAHLRRSLLAMKRLRLDRVWWLVTPGNPLKDTRGLQPLDKRIAAARALDAPSAHRRHRSRSRHRHPLHLRHDRFCAAAVPACVSSGSWAPTTCAASPLAELARHRRPGADRGGRPLGPSLYATGRPAAGARPLPHPEQDAAEPGRPQAPGLGLPPRPEIASVLDRACGGARTGANQNRQAGLWQRLKPLTRTI